MSNILHLIELECCSIQNMLGKKIASQMLLEHAAADDKLRILHCLNHFILDWLFRYNNLNKPCSELVQRLHRGSDEGN
jgi:hypothetical protein